MDIINKQQIINVGKNMEKLEILCVAVRNIKWYRLYGKHGHSSKTLNRGLWGDDRVGSIRNLSLHQDSNFTGRIYLI